MKKIVGMILSGIILLALIFVGGLTLLEYRPKDVDLGVDSNGIDRNERKGYINVPDRHIFVDKKREGRLYTYLSDDRNVLHVHEQGISSLVLFAKYYDSRFVIHLQFEFQESKACMSSFTRRYSSRK